MAFDGHSKLRVAVAINDDRSHPRKRCSLVVRPTSLIVTMFIDIIRGAQGYTPHFHYLIFHRVCFSNETNGFATTDDVSKTFNLSFVLHVKR